MKHVDASSAPLGGPPPLASVCGHLLRRAQQVHNALWLAHVGADPTSPQYAVLEAIAAAPGLDQRRIGELASLDKSSMMDIVDRLVRHDWIERRRDPSDGRRDVLLPTSETITALRRLRPRVSVVQELLVRPLDESPAAGSRTDFLRGLARVARVSPAQDPSAPLHIPGHLLRRAQQVHTALFADEFDRELTGPQYAALQTIAEHPGLSQAELGAHAALDKSTAADLVQRLARRGQIVLGVDTEDRRRRTLTVAPDTERTLAELAMRVARVQHTLLGPLPESDRTAFLAALRPIAYRADTPDELA
ncbi:MULTISPECIES: MarR family winged helix-turn-helix transcriptional regulator [Bacteria]